MNTKLPSVKINEKLRKRILRSKIAKILQDQFKNYCDRFLKSEKFTQEIITRKTQFDEEDEKHIKQQQFRPPMKFSQEQRNKASIFDATVPDAHQVQAKLKTFLSKQELLEIGEDPAYYLQDEELRQLNWNEEDWLDRSQSATNLSYGKMRIAKISSSSNLLKRPGKIKVFVEDNHQQKKHELITKQQQEMKEISEYRFQRFRENQKRENEIREQIYEKLQHKYKDKIVMTNKRIEAKENGVQKKKEISQEEYKIKNQLIDEYAKQQQQIEELKVMTQKFKTLCEEKQVQEIKRQYMSQSLEKTLLFNKRVLEISQKPKSINSKLKMTESIYQDSKSQIVQSKDFVLSIQRSKQFK